MTIKAPQDHKKSAAQIDAEGTETTTIEYNGHEFTFPSEAQDWSNDVLLAFEAGKAVDAIRMLVGTRRWASLKMGSWTGRQTKELFDAFADAAGFDTSGN
jgi:hypothetical protein